eukprot:4658342-Amphidinium_carterae.1
MAVMHNFRYGQFPVGAPNLQILACAFALSEQSCCEAYVRDSSSRGRRHGVVCVCCMCFRVWPVPFRKSFCVVGTQRH